MLTPRTVQKGKQKIDRFNSAVKRRKKLFSPKAEKENITESVEPDNDADSGPEFTAELFLEPTVVPDEPDTGFQREVGPTERQQLLTEMDNLRSERDSLQEQIDNMKRTKFGADMVSENDDKCKFYTGLSWAVFIQTFTFLAQFLPASKPGTLNLKDQFFVTLVKLRQDTNFDYLADQVGLGRTTVADIFWKWVKLIEAKLSFMIQWPDREAISRTVPPVFKDKFPRLTCIIDCFEIFIDSPNNLKARAQCYSNYKRHTTVKFLIGCNPLGAVVFLSRAWGGRVSDIELTRQSGFISHQFHHPGDQILADRGFTLQDDFASQCSAELILPPFKRGKKQLSAQEVETARALSTVRILIERVIGLMKNRFAILRGTMPIQFMNSVTFESEEEELASVDICVRSCAILTNLGDGIVFKN